MLLLNGKKEIDVKDIYAISNFTLIYSQIRKTEKQMHLRATQMEICFYFGMGLCTFQTRKPNMLLWTFYLSNRLVPEKQRAGTPLCSRDAAGVLAFNHCFKSL